MIAADSEAPYLVLGNEENPSLDKLPFTFLLRKWNSPYTELTLNK